eukprot:274820-Lingulodinium_polyedra.AAC.1
MDCPPSQVSVAAIWASSSRPFCAPESPRAFPSCKLEINISGDPCGVDALAAQSVSEHVGRRC